MAMQRQLYSPSALAVELGKDRRTIAKALDGVPQDGMVLGRKAWFLTTAMRALGPGDGAAPVARAGSGGLLDIIRDRITDGRQLQEDEPLALPLTAVAEIMGVPVSTVLVWLRAGCPYYGTPGDWQTGDGFQLNLAWLAEWSALVGGLIERSGDRGIAHRLALA
jgi:hypothetical protein